MQIVLASSWEPDIKASATQALEYSIMDFLCLKIREDQFSFDQK